MTAASIMFDNSWPRYRICRPSKVERKVVTWFQSVSTFICLSLPLMTALMCAVRMNAKDTVLREGLMIYRMISKVLFGAGEQDYYI